jgi:glutamate-ammonia-ligase adenylyltransferase
LDTRVQSLWARYQEAAGEHARPVLENGPVMESLSRVWSASDFVSGAFIRDPALFASLCREGAFVSSHSLPALAARFHDALSSVTDEEGLKQALRLLRRREMLVTAWRDLAGWASLEESLARMTDLAALCLSHALARLETWQCAADGEPLRRDGRPQRLLVIGMGKLGAGELNFSSDIDLIFAYPEDGETSKGKSNLDHFTRLARKLVAVLGQNTADGFVFRVDTRLRPYGESGPLALSFEAMETYYESQGREWERYAWVKAGCVAGGKEDWPALWGALRPFVYRRYLDYGVFDSLREMKRMIAQECARKKLGDDIKLGPGGIREIEFIGQVLELLRGGVIPSLQKRPILEALDALMAEGQMEAAAGEELARAYLFLRRCENRLQEWADMQTHTLPKDPLREEALAYSMDFDSHAAFMSALNAERRVVHGHFDALLSQGERQGEDSALARFREIFEGADDGERTRAALEGLGFEDPGASAARLLALKQSPRLRNLAEKGRARLSRVASLILSQSSRAERPPEVLSRLLDIVEAVGQRATYLALLEEEPRVLPLLADLCAASPQVSARVARHPVLLDELVDPGMLYNPPDKAGLVHDLARTMARAAPGDVEEEMDALRLFKQVNVLRVIAADVTGALPLMKVSDRLTWIAEAALDETIRRAHAYLTKRHGPAECFLGGASCGAGFAVAGYGKLGGLELGYGSDLDLVFLHAGDPLSMTNGERPLDTASFFARMGQRVIHYLATHTNLGHLYEIDMRLRPSGSSGVLASNIEAWREYMLGEAWTWERQALVRARFVAGDPIVGRRFEEIRKEVLRLPRDREKLREDVVSMRDKMRAGLDKSGEGMFDLKQGLGGIVDIEFLNQYLVLALAYEYPEMAVWSDNVRILETIVSIKVLRPEVAKGLKAAYLAFRADTHRSALEFREALAPEERHREHRALVRRLWEEVLGE